MGNRKSDKTGRDALFEENWRSFAYGSVFFFVLFGVIGGEYIAAFWVIGACLLAGLIALAIGDS
jgi:hypothetical protein